MIEALLVRTALSPETGAECEDRSGDWINRAGALILIVAASPLLVAIGAMVLVTSGRPIFYRGARLGKGKQLFDMFKFRTLRPDAEQIIGGNLLNGSMDLTTPFGKWLRGTRLDELPQLFNILKGEMRFLGPRPERPSVYEAHCREIPGYEYRFSAKPGLIGYAQVFTPHGTPKAIRAKVDNLLATKPRTRVEKLRFVLYTGWLVVLATLHRVWRAARWAVTPPAERKRERMRKLPREALSGATARFALCGREARIMDINESAMRVRIPRPLVGSPEGELEMRIAVRGRNGRSRTRSARCRGTTSQVRESENGVDCIVVYEPVTPVSDYTVQQYFLRNSIARPGRS